MVFQALHTGWTFSFGSQGEWMPVNDKPEFWRHGFCPKTSVMKFCSPMTAEMRTNREFLKEDVTDRGQAVFKKEMNIKFQT